MATNKRFLGLGFTFTATDKGLEKKLQGVNTALQGIADSLTRINSQSQTAGSALGKVKAPSTRTRSAKSRISDMGSLSMAIDHLTATVKKGFARMSKLGGVSSRPKPAVTMTRLTSVPDPSKQAHKLVAGIENLLGKDLGKKFTNTVKTWRLQLDEAGNFTEDSTRRLKNLAEAYIEGNEAIGRYTKSFNLVKKSFDFLQHWFHDVGNSVERFLSSVGVDLQTIIPEQFKALFGIAKSVFAPLVKGVMSLPKMLLSNVFKKEKEEIQSEMLKQLRALFDTSEKQNGSQEKAVATLGEISEKLGGRPTGQKNTLALLENISDNTKPETKSMFGKIGDFFKGFGKKLLGFAAMIPGLGLLKKILGPLTGLFETLGKFLKPVVNLLGPLARALSVVGAIAVLAASAGMFLKGFGETVKKNWKVFQDFGAAVSRLVDSFIKSHPLVAKFADVIGSAIKKLADFGSSLVQIPKSLYDSLPKGFDTVTGMIGEGIRALIDALITAVTHPIDFLKTSLQGWEMIGQKAAGFVTDATQFATEQLNKMSDNMDKTAAPAPATKPMRDDLSDLLQNQTDTSSKLMTRQLQLQQDQNSLMQRMLDALQNPKDNQLKANIKIQNNSDAQLKALAIGVQ